MTETTSEAPALAFAHDLLAHGVPVVVCTPNPAWREGAKVADLDHPQGWSTITAAECDISRYRQGVDALAMVSGHGIDTVDVDTKVGGSAKNLPAFRSFGVTLTPSGGGHFYVRSTGIGKISPLTTSSGHVGDYAGGTPGGGGRMLVYLPGSTRAKYPGRSYSLIKGVDFDELSEHEADDDLIGALIGAGGNRNSLPGNRAARWSDVRGWRARHEEPATCPYGRSAVEALLVAASTALPGDPTLGRHGWATRSVTRVVELANHGCASAHDLDTIAAKLDEIKPEGGTDFGGIVAWALTNADGGTRCNIHRDREPGEPPPPIQIPVPVQRPDDPAPGPEPAQEADLEELDLIHGIDAALYRGSVAQEVVKLHIATDARALHAVERAGVSHLPPLVRLDDFLAEPDPDVTYRIDKVWPSGGRVVLAAQFKAGKSTAVGNLLRSFADGDRFLDAFDATAAQRVTLLDNELDQNMLRRWLREQGVVDTAAVHLASLRGRLSTFNILEPAVRSRWAERISGAEVLVFDCLRPALDALGLDENRDAGRFLEAFDELITEAGIGEALIVHHMGHSGERSRGDSRILDWPDALWRLLKEDAGDGTETRYFTAYGRDVDVSEMRLGYDPLMRRLFKVGGSRSDRRVEAALEDVLIALGDAGIPLSGRGVEEVLANAGHAQKVVRAALRRGVENGVIRTFEGPRRAVMHMFTDPSAAVRHSASPVRQRTDSECVSASIDDALHSHSMQTPESTSDLTHCTRCHQRLSLARASRGATLCVGCDR